MMLTGVCPRPDSCLRGQMVRWRLGILGLKVGMTQVYDETGKIAPVTVLQIGPCPILLVRNQERDGYHAVQLGYLDKASQSHPAERGHVSDSLGSQRRTAPRQGRRATAA